MNEELRTAFLVLLMELGYVPEDDVREYDGAKWVEENFEKLKAFFKEHS